MMWAKEFSCSHRHRHCRRLRVRLCLRCHHRHSQCHFKRRFPPQSDDIRSPHSTVHPLSSIHHLTSSSFSLARSRNSTMAIIVSKHRDTHPRMRFRHSHNSPFIIPTASHQTNCDRKPPSICIISFVEAIRILLFVIVLMRFFFSFHSFAVAFFFLFLFFFIQNK